MDQFARPPASVYALLYGYSDRVEATLSARTRTATFTTALLRSKVTSPASPARLFATWRSTSMPVPAGRPAQLRATSPAIARPPAPGAQRRCLRRDHLVWSVRPRQVARQIAARRAADAADRGAEMRCLPVSGRRCRQTGVNAGLATAARGQIVLCSLARHWASGRSMPSCSLR